MLPLVKTKKQSLKAYEKMISKELFDEIQKTAKNLQGLKVFHVNAKPFIVLLHSGGFGTE